MEPPDGVSQETWLASRFARRNVDRGTSEDGERYYEDDDGNRYPSTTTIIDRIDFSAYPEESELHESTWPLRAWKRNTEQWWIKYWYKRLLGILAHYEITSQMDVSTPDDRAEAREELIRPSEELVSKHSKETLFRTLQEYDDVGIAAEGWEYDRYPADHPLYDVARRDAEDIAYCWRREIRPELNIGYDDVFRGELKFIRLLEGDGWPPLGYGGQIDLVAELRGKLRAVDIKTGTLRMPHRMQVTAYQHAFDEIEGAALVHVSPDGDWSVEYSEEWPQQSLWEQFRSEIIL